MYKEKIVDILSGDISFRDYTEKEIVEVEKAKKAAEEETQIILAKQETRNQILQKLGLTADDLKALGL